MKTLTRDLAALLILSASFCAKAADWPHWRGPDYNGISKETGCSAQWPADGPKRLWKASVGIGFASLSVSQGRAYTVGNKDDTDTVFCFKADTGEVVWKYSHASKLDPKFYEGGPSATPTVDGDRVYSFNKRGVLHCLGAAKGDVIWSKDLMMDLNAEMPTWGFASSVYVEGDLCIVNAGAAGTALDKKTGKVVWSSGTTAAGYSTAVPFEAKGEHAVLLVLKQDMAALRVKDGHELWRYPWKTQYDVNAADAIPSGEKVFVSSGYGHGSVVLDVDGGKPKPVWEKKDMRNHFNSSVFWKGDLYGVDEGERGQLRCVAFEDGALKWSDKSVGKGSLMMADGKLIVLGEKGELMVADASPEGFKPISRAQVLSGKCWSVPVLANGKIYCRNAAGDVVCVDVSGK